MRKRFLSSSALFLTGLVCWAGARASPGQTAAAPTSVRVGGGVEVLASDQRPFLVPIYLRHRGDSGLVHIGLDYDELMLRFTESWSMRDGISRWPWKKMAHNAEEGTIELSIPFDAWRGGKDQEALLVQLEFVLLPQGPEASSYGYRATSQISVVESQTAFTRGDGAMVPVETLVGGGVTVYFKDALEVRSVRLTPAAQLFRVPVYVTHVNPENDTFLMGLDYDELFLDLVQVKAASPLIDESRIRFDDRRVGGGLPWIEAPFHHGRYPALLRHHLLDLVFQYRAEAGVPADQVLQITPVPGNAVRAAAMGEATADRGAGGSGGVEIREGWLYLLAPKFIRGDSNGSGDVALDDVLVLLDFVFDVIADSEPPACLDPMDIDAGGKVNVTDAIRLLGYLFMGDRPPAMPFPEPGVSPPGAPILGCPGDAPDVELLPLGATL